MAEYDGREKTEQPTPKKLDDARDKGQVAKSMEVNSLAIFGTGLILLYLFQNFVGSRLKTFSISIFDSLDVLPHRFSLISNFAADWYFFFILTLAPFLGGLLIIALVTNVSQVGMRFSSQALMPKFDKLNVSKGIKNLISSRSLVELLKSMFKLLIIGGFTYLILNDFISSSASLESLNISEIVQLMLDQAFSLLWKIGLVYLIIASSDFVFQRFKFKKEMMMTKEEVKEEVKQTEGDPQIKSRIRKLMYEASRNRMMQELPKADVVITNPTHYAVALKYDLMKHPAPEVIAKGVDELAQKIKKVAIENDIPIQENKELARALYKMCDIGDKIPPTLFKAVAQVLAYVYNLKKSKKKKSIV